MKINTKMLSLAILFSLPLLALTACTPKYAVLVSTNEVLRDNVPIHSEWWYDLVLQYKMLREAGFKDAQIYVLYGDGQDFQTVYPDYDTQHEFGHSITDMGVTKANIRQVFATVRDKMNAESRRGYLYVWWMGHGGGSGPGQCDLAMSIHHRGERVSDEELRSYVEAVEKYEKRSISIMTCHSGGILDEFAGDGENNVVLASSTCAESSYDAPHTCNGRLHAEFNYTQPSALRQMDPCGSPIASDADTDGWISLSETHQFNIAEMLRSTPQLGDPDAVAASTIPKKRIHP